MHWEDIPGQIALKKQLQESIQNNRVAHAQLFYGMSGSGILALALAYARAILCREDEKANAQFDAYQHPDLFFTYPIAINKEKKVEKSPDVLPLWREFLNQNVFGSFRDWINHLDATNKRPTIAVEDASEILKNFSLKSYQGGYKVQLIWMAEKMNPAAANKLLKLIEEPPEKSLLLLVAEDTSNILPTIVSRCQTVSVPSMSYEAIEEYLTERFQLDSKEAKTLAFLSQNDLGKAIELSQGFEDNFFEAYFIRWIRNAFLAKKKLSALRELNTWVGEIYGWGREKQMEFLRYSLGLFRQALFENYQIKSVIYKPIQDDSFGWENFSKFVHGANIEAIMNEIDRAHHEIGRNTNAKAVLLDLSISVTRLIHKKQVT